MVLSSTKANTKYAFKHKHKQKTRKHLFKRINKSATYKNKNNKRTYKQRTLRGGAGALGAGGVVLPEIKAVKAIVVIGGYGGTISRTLLNDLNVPNAAKTFDIFYFARTQFSNGGQKSTQMTEEQLANPNKPIFCKCDLNSQVGLNIFVENLKKILDAYTKTFIINCAADKDSSTVMKSYIKTDKYKDAYETYKKKLEVTLKQLQDSGKNLLGISQDIKDSEKNFLTQRNQDKPTYTLNLSIKEIQYWKQQDLNWTMRDWHWTMHVAYNLAVLCKDDTYKTKLHLIHLSTVYVNKGAFLLPNQYKWSNDYVNYRKYNKELEAFHQKQIEEDPNDDTRTITVYNIDPAKVEFNNYIYGLIKGLTEQIIKLTSDKNNNFVIIRLPVIMNEKLTNLDETSPSKVVKQVFEKIESFINGATEYTDKDKALLSSPPLEFNDKLHLEFDNKHQRYPISAQYVSKYIIDKINTPISADTPWTGIHSLCNTQSITKFEIARAFYLRLYKTRANACKKLNDSKCPFVDNFIFVDKDADYDNYLPYSENMDRDIDLVKSMPLNENNIMESIIKGFEEYYGGKIYLETVPSTTPLASL